MSHRPAIEQKEALRSSIWPAKDYSRIPYRLYHDEATYQLEQERIFRGDCWAYVGLEAEIPKPGDFRRTQIGDTQVVFGRASDGVVYAFVNFCAHRGALVVRDNFGNAEHHTCIYHRWRYDQKGNLTVVPFRRGVRGLGGLEPDFDMAKHGLRKLRCASVAGVIFCTFSDRTESIETYLGSMIHGHLLRTFNRPVKVLGYQRQRVRSNWKLYSENLRDLYHGSLLHEFQRTFGLSRVTQAGGTRMDPRHRHGISYTTQGTDDNAETQEAYRQSNLNADRLHLTDERMTAYVPEFADGESLTICSVFSNAMFQQIRNSLAVRQIRTHSVDEFEIYATLFGYVDDTEEMQAHRLRQANMVGPAGLVSMEDGEACEIVQRGTRRELEAAALVEMGGKGAITDLPSRVNDISVRGFWSYYAELMGIEPDGAPR